MMNLFAAGTVLAQTEAPAGEAGLSGFLLFLIIVAVFVLPFLAGAGLARLLKLKDMGFRMGVVLLAIFLGVTPFAYRIATGDPQLSAFERAKEAIPLGIDLAGGTNLVYEVDTEAAESAGKDVSASMDRMVGAIARRINPSGTEEVTVRRVGSDRLEVIIPGADRQVVEEKKRMITRLGSLEFEILANERDHRQLISQARKLPDNEKEVIVGTEPVAMWREIVDPEHFTLHGEIATRTVTEPDGTEIQEVLVLVTPERHRVTGKYLTRASETMDQNGTPAVSFNFNTQGAYLFQTLTSQNRPLEDGFQRRLAILLDGKVQSAPNIRETISSQGQISGDFTRQEIEELINVLNAGALEIPIKKSPVSENTISPLLGADVQEKGFTAILWAAVVVVVFMAAYYLWAGLIADFCLLVNFIMILGTMALIQATFTLPGLAGLVLTIGMAVDANVLIYERMREELDRGASLRMAIHNGFARAFSAIVDSNLTTLIAAVVLYVIGTDQVRGFAVTLFIGIVTSMFTAVYAGRVVFDVLERKRWLRDIKMMRFVGNPRIDFLKRTKLAFAASLLVIVVGLGAVVARGKENLDIDFRGGTMVTFEFVEPQEIGSVRDALEEEFGTGITLERLTLAGEEQSAAAGKQYRLRTTNQNVQEVSQTVALALNDAGYELRRVTADIGEIQPIEAEEDSTQQSTFVGGHQVEVALSGPVTEATISDYLANELRQISPEQYETPAALYQVTGLEGPGVEAASGDVREYTVVRVEARPSLPLGDFEKALGQMQQTMATTPIFNEVNSFDSAVAVEMQRDAILALFFSMLAIIAYIWFRFERVTFGLAAVAALVHDVLVVLGSVAIASYLSDTAIGQMLAFSDFKINLPMVAAFMTLIGYSLNDTIVIFDRIREVRGKNPALTKDMVNISINQTLSRTLLTAFTTWVVVAILYAFGGEGIHGFAFCLTVGAVVGAYSTVYLASPVLIWLMNRSGNGTERSASTGQTQKAAAAM